MPLSTFSKVSGFTACLPLEPPDRPPDAPPRATRPNAPAGCAFVSSAPARTARRVTLRSRGWCPQTQTGSLRRANAGGALPLDEPLDDAVFERVEGDDRQPATGRQHVDRACQGRFQRRQLVVRGDAQRLERARGGMRVAAAAPTQGAGDDLRQPRRRLDRRPFPLVDDGAGDAPAAWFLAVAPDEVGQFPLRKRVHQVARRSSLVRGSKRMSSGPARRKANPRSGSSSWNDERPRSSRMPSRGTTSAVASNRRQVGEVGLDRDEAFANAWLLLQSCGAVDRRRIEIEGEDDPVRRRRREHRPRVTTAAEGAVEVAPPGTRAQGRDDVIEQDRLVAGERSCGRRRHGRHSGQASSDAGRAIRQEEYATPRHGGRYAAGEGTMGDAMPFATNDGIRIHYEVEGAGAPLVLFHGLTGSGERWRDTGYVSGLANDYRLILIDARGHGQSDKPHDPASYAREIQAADVVAVLDDLGVDRAHFLGPLHGWQRRAHARPRPPRPRPLADHHRLQPVRRRGGGGRRDGGLGGGSRGWHRRLRRRLRTAPRRAPRRRPRPLAGQRRRGPIRLRRHHDRRGGRQPRATSLPIATPVMFLVGTEEPFVEQARTAASLLPNGAFVSLEGLDHVQTFFRSDLLLPHVRGFLAAPRTLLGVSTRLVATSSCTTRTRWRIVDTAGNRPKLWLFLWEILWNLARHHLPGSLRCNARRRTDWAFCRPLWIEADAVPQR